MARIDQGMVRVVEVVLRNAAAGFALGVMALTAAEPALPRNATLMTMAEWATGQVGVAGVAAVASCLVFTTALVSLGVGLLLASYAMRLMAGGGEARARWSETALGVTMAVGAMVTGTLTSALPVSAHFLVQCIMVLLVYPYTHVNEMIAVLSVIFSALHLSVVLGRMGVLTGLSTMGIAASSACALLKALSERTSQRDDGQSKWSQRLLLYIVVVAIVGFPMGVGTGMASGSGSEVTVMLESVLWVGTLVAGLLGAALGTVVVVSLGPEGAARVAVAAAVTSSSLRLILPACPLLGSEGSIGGLLGGATAAGVSLGAASVATELRTTKSTLVVLGSVAVGTLLGLWGVAQKNDIHGPSEIITVALVAVVAFLLGAPWSPFHKPIELRGEVLIGTSLMRGVGMETVTAAAAPLGAGALGAAALGTAALGTLGTVGVLGAALVALGKTTCGL